MHTVVVPLSLAAVLALSPLACSTSAKPGSERVATTAEPSPREEPPALPLDGEYLTAEVATVGWDGLTNAPIVLLRDQTSGQVVPIWIGVAEAQAIAMALHEVEMPRPMTHDLMRDLLGKLGAKLSEVIVHDLIDGTYYGFLKLNLASGTEPLLVDTRPSDGIALAVRTGAVIRIARKILEESPDFDFLAPAESDQVVRIFGMTLVVPTAEQRQDFTLPDRPGLLVTRATGEAARQGLKRGDLLVEVNGKVPEEPVDFLDATRDVPAGEKIRLTYWRAGEEHTLELKPELLEEDDDEDKPKQVA